MLGGGGTEMELAGKHADLRLEDSPAQRHIIKRPRLTKLLDTADARVLLLIAPAGYGKTTLAREWTTQRGRRGLWYRARVGASDVAAVARALSAALAPLSPTVERSTRELLAALNMPEDEPEVIADLLAEELDGWPTGTWLVLDECELVAPHAGPTKLIERFVQASGAHVLITSRERPAWITPRDLLYGDAFELRGAALSMTLDEATRILGSETHAPAGLVALADGWPAVIGLAALLPGEVNPTSDVESALFDYVAQELFDGLDADVQRHLVLLSVPSTLSYRLVQAAVGADTDRVLHDSIRAGLVTARERDEPEIHPLCRAFLERKLPEIDGSRGQVDALAAFLIDTAQWDDAFELIRRFDLDGRLPLLIERGLREVLAEGRLAAVEKWMSWADARRLEPPELALVRAEIYLRRGDLELSESLAMTCVQVLRSPKLAAQAHLCAGAAAHLLDQVDRAWDHYGRALESDASADIRRRALWGRFIASYWTRQPDSRSALEALERAGDPSPNHLLRLGQAKLVVAEQNGDVSRALAEALAAEPLLSHVEDPFVRSGFLNSVAHVLGLAARYSEAEAFSTRQIDEARRFRLQFAHPTALLNLATAKLGLGQYTAAAALVERSQRVDTTHDSFLRVKREVIRACIALSRGDAEGARSALNAAPLEGARSDIIGEALATRALAEACSGEIKAAEQSVDAAKHLARDVNSQVLLAAIAAILALEADASVLEPILDALARTASVTGCFDTAICAMRAHPKLVVASQHNAAMNAMIRTAAEQSGDTTLAAAVGAPIRHRGRGSLTTRELEVLALTAEGFHNDQIGRRLFISPKTVKTHLQNIYEKLDVTSRTQAVTKAHEEGLLR